MNWRSWQIRILVFVSLMMSIQLFAQLERIDVSTKQSLRGLALLNDSVVWLSGTNGTYLFTENGGESWKVDSIFEAKGLDFRDIEIINDSTVYVLSVGSPALLYKTVDKGKHWKLLLKDERKDIFLDGMSFWKEGDGVLFGDPLDKKLLVAKIFNDSVIWLDNLPPVIDGEAGFAASGTGVVALKDSLIWVATGGGNKARVFRSIDKGVSWEVFDTPMVTGEGKGIFSMAFWDENEGVIVGGSYVDSTNTFLNCAITKNGGEHWKAIDENQPNGYRSCVAADKNGSLLIACGRTGIDYSLDKGVSWRSFSQEGYYSVSVGEKYAWFSGRKGKVAKVLLEEFYK